MKNETNDYVVENGGKPWIDEDIEIALPYPPTTINGRRVGKLLGRSENSIRGISQIAMTPEKTSKNQENGTITS